MSDLGTKPRDHRGENGFTLIELLVVVTIIGILAAIVSVSVGGFTGKASVQAHKTTITAVQAAVDAYISDHYDGSGAVVAPTLPGQTTVLSGSWANLQWYDTNGLVQSTSVTIDGATIGTNIVFIPVQVHELTKSTSTIIGNTTRTHGPYLRLAGNAADLLCVFKNTTNVATTNTTVDGAYKVVLCSDVAQTAQ